MRSQLKRNWKFGIIYLNSKGIIYYSNNMTIAEFKELFPSLNNYLNRIELEQKHRRPF